MLVSIGTPTFNRADGYLKYALESAIHQTYKDIEIIISDNCSTDNTEELVRSYNDERIKYIKQPKPLHPIDNFNYCLEIAQGDYFLMLHDDDIIDTDFIETCVKAANGRRDYGLIRTGMRRIDHNGDVIDHRTNLAAGLDTKDFFKAWIEEWKTPMHLCCTLFNTKGLREVGGFQSEQHLFADVVPEVKLAAKYERLDIEEVKASFRKHTSNLAGRGRIQAWCDDSHYLMNIMIDLVGDNDESFRRSCMHFFTKHCYRYAAKIDSTTERLAAYFIIYKSFDYAGVFLFNNLFIKRGKSFYKRIKRKFKLR